MATLELYLSMASRLNTVKNRTTRTAWRATHRRLRKEAKALDALGVGFDPISRAR